MLAQQGFSVIYNKLIVLAAAITPRKLVRFTSHSSQLSWTKMGQKMDKNGTKGGQGRDCVAILKVKLQILNCKMMGRTRMRSRRLGLKKLDILGRFWGIFGKNRR